MRHIAAEDSVQAPAQNLVTRITSDLIGTDLRTSKPVFMIPDAATMTRLGQAATTLLEILRKPAAATA